MHGSVEDKPISSRVTGNDNAALDCKLAIFTACFTCVIAVLQPFWCAGCSRLVPDGRWVLQPFQQQVTTVKDAGSLVTSFSSGSAESASIPSSAGTGNQKHDGEILANETISATPGSTTSQTSMAGSDQFKTHGLMRLQAYGGMVVLQPYEEGGVIGRALTIDLQTGKLSLGDAVDQIKVGYTTVYGIMGMVKLHSGCILIVATGAEQARQHVEGRPAISLHLCCNVSACPAFQHLAEHAFMPHAPAQHSFARVTCQVTCIHAGGNRQRLCGVQSH